MTTNKITDDDIQVFGDKLVFNPYNSLNKEITKEEVETILKNYGVPSTVYNNELYRRSFVHKSYVKRPFLENEQENIVVVEKPHDCLPLSTKSNERLEFLGDGILEAITKYYLYRRFPKENEGFMTEKKIAIVKNENIGRIAYEMGLHKWLIISKHAEEKNTRTNIKKLGCLFEAFIGALFLDFNKISIKDDDLWFQNVFVTGPGFQIAQIFIESIFEKHIDWTDLINNDDNFKNILQVKIQKEFKVTPHYIELETDEEEGYKMGVYICLGQQIHETSPNNAIPFQQFKVFSKIQEYMKDFNKVLIFMASSYHKIKRKAEQMACEKALALL
jgi:dsRNA-specific ribonuclease